MSKVLLIFILSISVQSFAKVSCGSGVQFDDFVTIDADNGKDVDLEINGVGIKKVLFFNVFYGALYLEKSLGQSAEAIIKSNEYKVGMIHTLRKISKQQLVDMWDGEFERLCGDKKSCEKMRPHHEQFLSYTRDVAKGERLFLISFPDRIELEINMNETYPPIYSPDYARLMQNSLFGPDAADPELAKGLLGKKKICNGL